MKKFTAFLVEKRIWLFGATIVLAIACAVLMKSVTINEDLTQYLPDDSQMKRGLDIMESQFPETEQHGTFRVMFEGLSEEDKLSIQEEISSIPGIEGAAYEPESEDYNSGDYTLYVITTTPSEPEDVNAVLQSVTDHFEKDHTVYTYYEDAEDSILTFLVPIALVILVGILFLMCKSFFEPVLIIATIAVAIIMNMGSNVLLPSVADMTYSIAAVLQLVLSIDYSVILLHRYSQEREWLDGADNKQAMKNALNNTFSSIASSALTTVCGLLVLLMMSFTIGTDMGLVLAKGVILSLICTFTVMPTLILWSDKLLYKLNKTNLRSNMKRKKGVKEYA